MKSVFKMMGITLVEILFVAVIMASVLILAMRQYEQYREQQYIFQLRHNADALLEAMSTYYQANCKIGQSLGSSPFPSVFDDGGDLYDDLTNGYLPPDWQPDNPLVRNGYKVQFNLNTNNNRKAMACFKEWGTTTGTQGCNSPAPIAQAVVVFWQIQLAIEMSDPTMTQEALALTGADCALSTLPTAAAADCNQANSGTPKYLIWQRLPSLASPEIMKGRWLSQPLIKQFNEQYTHDPMYEIQLQSSGSAVNYLCNG